jgi:hypothetical protein
MRQFKTTTGPATTTETPAMTIKKKRKPCRFHRADHFLSRAEFEALLAAEPSPLYRTLWRLCLSRTDQGLALSPLFMLPSAH